MLGSGHSHRQGEDISLLRISATNWESLEGESVSGHGGTAANP